MKDHCYDLWCRNNGVEPLTPIERALGNQRHLERFRRLMCHHMTQGHFRYGSCQIYRDNPVNFSSKICESLSMFRADGNVEHFVDIANWAGMAFLYTDHPLKHYECHDKKRK